MTDTLTAAPVLSTPADYMLVEIENVSTSQSAWSHSEEEFKIRYEIDRTIREIRDNGWNRVALQFPDSMLSHSSRIFQLLSRGFSQYQSISVSQTVTNDPPNAQAVLKESSPSNPNVKLTILADTSYGSCCIDEIAAEHVEADAVVHYGRACLSPTARLPVLHIFTKNYLDEEAAARAFVQAFPDHDARVILTADIPYASHIQDIYRSLLSHGYQNVFAADIVHDPSSVVPNRTVPNSVRTNPSQLSDWHLYHIAEPPTALLLNLSSKVKSIVIHDPDVGDMRGDGRAQAANTSIILRRRYGLVTSLNTVSTWGVLINTLSVKNYLHVVDYVRRRIAATGRKSYLFVVGKLNAAKVANFSEIGGWVVVGCWESSLIDNRDFFKPILTPFELDLALASDEKRVWTGAWRSDFESVLANAVSTTSKEECEHEHERDHDFDSEEESAPPEFDLRTGKYVSQVRPLKQRNFDIENESNVGRQGMVSQTVAKRAKGNIVSVNGVASPAAEFLAQKRTWKGLGSDFDIRYEDDVAVGALVEEGRSGMARGYTVGESTKG